MIYLYIISVLLLQYYYKEIEMTKGETSACYTELKENLAMMKKYTCYYQCRKNT